MKGIMKLLLILLFLSVTAFAQNQNTTLIGALNPHPASGYSDIWGYTTPQGREYALLTARDALCIIDLQNPAAPVEVAHIPLPYSVWHDVKVHGNYAYVVTDQSGDGLHIVDLSELPDTARQVALKNNYFYNAHNIFIDNGYAYAIGTNGGGGMHILDLSNPTNPVRTAYYAASGYIHDVYVYHDTVIVCAGSSQSYHVVDVTNKSNPVKISESTALPGIYAHSGWMTEDKRYFIGCEEFNVRDITVWDLQDRTSWDLVVPEIQLPQDVIVHNLFIKGNYAHISYYEAGYVVLDITNPAFPVFVGRYDTYPASDGDNYNGAWGAYPYLPSGNVLISDMSTGLYVIRFDAPPAGLNQPPRITQNNQKDFFTTGAVTLTALMSDDSQVSGARLHYRVIPPGGSAGNWSSVSPVTVNGSNYNFIVPGQPHLTKVEYYFAALDDSGSVTTLPEGGSGTNPPGSVPPPEFYSYRIIIAGTPSLLASYPVSPDTTIPKNGQVRFTVYAKDTTSLPLTYRWRLNAFQVGTNDSTYLYKSSPLSIAPRVDTVRLTVTNGFFSTTKMWIINVTNSTTDIEDELNPEGYTLNQNYPNPFNPSTTISFSLPNAANVKLRLSDIKGEETKELLSGYYQAGNHSFIFNAEGLNSGVYIYILEADGVRLTRKMILLK